MSNISNPENKLSRRVHAALILSFALAIIHLRILVTIAAGSFEGVEIWLDGFTVDNLPVVIHAHNRHACVVARQLLSPCSAACNACTACWIISSLLMSGKDSKCFSRYVFADCDRAPMAIA